MNKNFIISCLMFFVFVGIVLGSIKTIKTNEVSVNPYSATTVTDKYVKGVNIYAESIGYKVSFDGTNYITLPANSSVNLNNLDITNFTLYLQGATESDTGNVQVILMK